MANATEMAVRAYEAAWNERDPEARARLLDACWAEDARLVSPGAVIAGRAALAKAMQAFRDDPRDMRARIVSAVDVQGPLFRFRAAVERADGSTQLGFDAGEVGSDGRITVLLTFGGTQP